MTSELLDTAVKLAALGTSGVCVAGLVWTGLLIARLPNDAERNRHGALRNYMLLCFGVAVVSAVSGFLSPTGERVRELAAANRDQVRELEATNREQVRRLEAANRDQAKLVAALQKTVQADEAQAELIRGQVRAVVRVVKVNGFIYSKVGPYLDKILELLDQENSAAVSPP